MRFILEYDVILLSPACSVRNTSPVLLIAMDEEEINLREREQEILKARENISPEILKEYKDIFSFFDRFVNFIFEANKFWTIVKLGSRSSSGEIQNWEKYCYWKLLKW